MPSEIDQSWLLQNGTESLNILHCCETVRPGVTFPTIANNVNICIVEYRRVVVLYAYSTPTKVAAVVCSGWAVMGRGPQGIVAGQSGLFLLDVSSACRVWCRNECRNECMRYECMKYECICGLDCLLYILVFGCLTALWLVRMSGFMIGWNKRVCDWSGWPEVRKGRLWKR
jgi:hypothetical protein